MVNITRFDPFADAFRLDPWKDFETMLRTWRRPLATELPAVAEFKMDVTEDEKAYTVKADLPGMRKEDIKITIDGEFVTIVAETRTEKEEKKGTTVYNERHLGRQERCFTLRHAVDEAKAEATYNDGVLQLTLPKKAVETAKEVAVH